MLSILLSLTLSEALNIVDYMYGDYHLAFEDEFERKEMLEFSRRLLEISDSSILPKVETLVVMVERLEKVENVKRILKDIKDHLVSKFGERLLPKNLVSIKAGREIYVYNCVVCHGFEGKGDGPASVTLSPKPTNFHERDDLSPLRIYTVLEHGVANMPPFPTLSEEDKWNVAFYVMYLRHRNVSTEGVEKPKLSLKEVVILSDEELSRRGLDRKAIAYVRKHPQEYFGSQDPIALITYHLRIIEELYKGGEYEKAYFSAMEIYFNYFEPLEERLLSKDFNFTRQLEQKFTILRGYLRSPNKDEEVERIVASIQVDLQKAKNLLEEKNFSSWWAFANSFVIIFREGFEAALLLAIILGIVSVYGNRKAVLMVHLGWILALVIGILTWLASETIMNISTVSRELMEGIVSLLASLVLFQVSYWLLSKAETKAWISYIKRKVGASISTGKLLGLAVLSFVAVYREAFETVLFYKAMVLNSSSSAIPYILGGFVFGAIVILALAYAILKLQLKLPLNRIFAITSFMLYVLSFIFLGQGIRELQEANVVPATNLPFIPAIDFLGIYPTLETTLAQLVLIVLAVFAYVAIAMKKRKEEDVIAKLRSVENEIEEILRTIDSTRDRICRFQNLIIDMGHLEDKLTSALSHLKSLEDYLKEFRNDIRKEVSKA